MRGYRVAFARRFQKDYSELPSEIQAKTDQQIRYLATGDFSYPSLRVKKMEGEKRIWEASVTMNYRMVFEIEDDLITFLKIGVHDIL